MLFYLTAEHLISNNNALRRSDASAFFSFLLLHLRWFQQLYGRTRELQCQELPHAYRRKEASDKARLCEIDRTTSLVQPLRAVRHGQRPTACESKFEQHSRSTRFSAMTHDAPDEDGHSCTLVFKFYKVLGESTHGMGDLVSVRTAYHKPGRNHPARVLILGPFRESRWL
eukprot:gene2388-8696_t